MHIPYSSNLLEISEHSDNITQNNTHSDQWLKVDNPEF